MFEDHQNLLSTFGKDSENSDRKIKKIEFSLKNKKLAYIYDNQPKTRYQQILKERKAQKLIQKQQFNSSNVKKNNKKLKTQSEIDYLNCRIRKSISSIAETINLSKINSNANSKISEAQSNHHLKRKSNHYSKQDNHKSYRKYSSRKKLQSFGNKENLDINIIKSCSIKNKDNNLHRNGYLKNSTKRKQILGESEHFYPIKSSFSIDLNSRVSSRLQSSRKNPSIQRKMDHQLNKIFIDKPEKRQIKNNDNRFQKMYPQIKTVDQMQETLKKSFKATTKPNYSQEFKFQQTQGSKIKKNQQFLFYGNSDDSYKNKQKYCDKKSKNFNNTASITSSNKTYTQPSSKVSRQHPLVQAFKKQIQLDYDLRHAKHMFSGIEEPFYAQQYDSYSQNKWEKLNEQLRKIGLHYSIQTIKKLFLPSEQQIDPFLSVNKPHQQLIYSLIYAYQTAQIHWQENIYQKWQHWDLRDIQLTIENIDRDRKGYINVEDIAAFLSLQSGIQYKNRDVVLIFKRFMNFREQKQTFTSEKLNQNLKFRSLIDSLIKPFNHRKFINIE